MVAVCCPMDGAESCWHLSVNPWAPHAPVGTFVLILGRHMRLVRGPKMFCLAALARPERHDTLMRHPEEGWGIFVEGGAGALSAQVHSTIACIRAWEASDR